MNLPVRTPCPFGKENYADSSPEPPPCFRETLPAALRISPLQANVAGQGEVPTEEGNPKQFPFGNELEVKGKACQEKHNVEHALVIRDDDVGLPLLNPFQTFHSNLPKRKETGDRAGPNLRNGVRKPSIPVLKHKRKRPENKEAAEKENNGRCSHQEPSPKRGKNVHRTKTYRLRFPFATLFLI